MTVQTYTSKSRIGTNQLNQVLCCKEAHCRRVALIGAMWVRLIATCWQSLCIFNQTTDICKPSSFCLRAVAAVVWRVVEITWQNSGMVVRSLRVSLNQELAADHFFWASSRTRSTCLWLLTVIFKGRCRLVRRDQSATMFWCVVHGKITSKTQGFPTEHHTLIWWLMYFTSPVEDFISGGLSKSRWTSFSCCLFCFFNSK